MIDDVRTHNFLNYTLVKKLKLPKIESDCNHQVNLAKGIDHTIWDTVVLDAPIEI